MIKFRTGRANKGIIYAQLGLEPDRDNDLTVLVVDSTFRHLTAGIVTAMNKMSGMTLTGFFFDPVGNLVHEKCSETVGVPDEPGGYFAAITVAACGHVCKRRDGWGD